MHDGLDTKNASAKCVFSAMGCHICCVVACYSAVISDSQGCEEVSASTCLCSVPGWPKGGAATGRFRTTRSSD